MTRTKFAALLILIFFSANGKAQTSYIGIWQGRLMIGKALRVFFTIRDTTGGKLYGTMDSPDQMAYDIPFNSVEVHNDSLLITFPRGMGTYKGIMTADSITGTLAQGSNSSPMTLRKTNIGVTFNRPQTPHPPFSYISENVTYENEDKTIRYGATITIPNGKGKFPAILMVTGSGPQNRDEEILQHRPFAVIADYLTKKGYIVLRVDDRGMGETTGNFKSATSLDFMHDAEASLRYLRSRKEVNLKKVGIAGHSEGGMIAPMIAASDKDIDFIILLAGPGEKISRLMHEQNEMVLEKAHIAQEAIESYMTLYDTMVYSASNAPDAARLQEEIAAEVSNWRSHTPYNVVFATTKITNDSIANEFVNKVSKQFSSPWWRYFFSYDPAPNLEKLSCKVLALNGEKDIQVPAKNNLSGMRNALAKSKSKTYDVIELKGLNHLFQKCNTCSTTEYAQLEETFSPDALAAIGDWLDKNVK